MEQPRRKGGRPKGSKNKKTLEIESRAQKEAQRILEAQGYVTPEEAKKMSKAANQPVSDKVIGIKKDYSFSDEERERQERCWKRLKARLTPSTNTNILVGLLNKYQNVVEESDSVLMEPVIARAKRQFSFFTRHFVKIVDSGGKRIDLELNKSQRITHAQHLRHLRNTGYARTIILKARQQGLTTYTNARTLHHGLFHKEAYSMMMSLNQTNSSDNLTSIRDMFKELPKWVLNFWVYQYAANTGDHKDSASEMQFDSHASESQARFVTANANGDGPRGKRANFFHWTETAFCEDAEEAFTAITPMIRKRAGAPFIIESTANGLGNWFADQCLNIHNGGLSTFHMVFLPWHIDDSNQATPPEGFSLNEEELKLQEKYGLNEAQLYWRRLAIADENGDVQKFNQEYPISVESAFMTSDNLFYSAKCQEIIEEQIVESLPAAYRVDEDGINMYEFGTFLVYDKPKHEYQYVIGIDCAEGTTMGDYTVITVVDPTGTLVAQYRDKPTPEEACAIANRIGRWYNNAMMCIERGNIGGHVMRALHQQWQYKNILFDDDKRIGWRPLPAAKYSINAQLQDDVVSGKIVVPSAHLLSEMQTYIVKPGTKTLTAKVDNHDDVIMSTAIAYHAWRVVRPQLRRRTEQQNKWSQRPKRRLSVR